MLFYCTSYTDYPDCSTDAVAVTWALFKLIVVLASLAGNYVACMYRSGMYVFRENVKCETIKVQTECVCKSTTYRNRTSWYYYLRQGGNVFARLCLSVCVSKITQKVMDGSFWNFEGMSGMAQATSDSILGVIRKESSILDHFEIFVTIAFNGA